MRGMRGYKHITIACGRQWGKTTIIAMYLTWYLATHKDRQVFIIAPTTSQARIMFELIKNYFLTSKELIKLVDKRKIVMNPFPRLETHDGCILQARGSAHADYLRGNHAHIVVEDESAFIPDQTENEVIEPFLATTIDNYPDAQHIKISSPQGEGHFKESFDLGQGKSRYYRSFQFPSSSSPHVGKQFLAKKKKQLGELSLIWRAEYLAEFVDGALSIFGSEDIRAAISLYEKLTLNLGAESDKQPLVPLAPVPGRLYIQGVDLAGQGQDFTVATIWDVTDKNQLTLVHYDRIQRATWPRIYEVIRNNHHYWNKARTILDSTGLGDPVVSELKDIGAEGYKIGTNEAKQVLVNSAVRAFSNRIVAIPSDQDIASELKYFQASFTKGGNVKMEASKGHDDIVLSICLGLYLATTGSSIGFFRGFGETKQKKEGGERFGFKKHFQRNFRVSDYY